MLHVFKSYLKAYSFAPFFLLIAYFLIFQFTLADGFFVFFASLDSFQDFFSFFLFLKSVHSVAAKNFFK